MDHGDLGDTVTIPVGQSSASVTVTPLADSLAEGAETVVLTLAPDPRYIVGAPASAQVDLADLPTDAWRFLAFGANANNPAIAGDMMDPDGDGLSNLLECAFATPPLAQSPTQPILGMEGNSVTLTYQRATSAPDLTFTIEESSDLAAWSAANASEQILSDNGTVRVVKATVPINSATRKLLRLRVSR